MPFSFLFPVPVHHTQKSLHGLGATQSPRGNSPYTIFVLHEQSNSPRAVSMQSIRTRAPLVVVRSPEHEIEKSRKRRSSQPLQRVNFLVGSSRSSTGAEHGSQSNPRVRTPLSDPALAARWKIASYMLACTSVHVMMPVMTSRPAFTVWATSSGTAMGSWVHRVPRVVRAVALGPQLFACRLAHSGELDRSSFRTVRGERLTAIGRS